MDWELDDSRSIYPQLKELIKRGIITGEYAPGSAFPTVRELASDAGVNRNTMQRAMAELENEGLLITNRTAGRTVTTDLPLIEQMRRELAEKQVDTFLRALQKQRTPRMAQRVKMRKRKGIMTYEIGNFSTM